MSFNNHHGNLAGASGSRAAHYSEKNYGAGTDDEEDTGAPFTATLSSVPLGSDEENRRLLDQVDKLRECGVDEYIDLPQIVVVGDQSSGKSSVLEGLTKIPFPRESVKCTRFATQIGLRRAVQVRRIVRIKPHSECTPDEKKRLSEFEENIEQEADFEAIFQHAMDAIFPEGVAHNRFLSKNILIIEVSGPDQPHLTVVDLPGFIHSPSMNQTAEDVADIVALATEYMKKERTIVLPVVSGDIEYSKQVVLRTIKELDPNGIRTLGIITKPDMTLTEAREKEFINLASNKDKRNKLQLGWHVLRNRSHDQMNYSAEERKIAEADFFAGSNWSRELKEDQLGIDALSKRLSTQLIRHIAAEVFKVEDDIDRELRKCREKLLELGDGIDTPEEMEKALYAWCERSSRLTLAALQGMGVNPPGEDFFPSYNDGRLYARNFRSRVVQENRRFAEEMEVWGSSCLIVGEEGVQKGKSTSKSGGAGTSLPEIKRSDYIKQEVIPLLRDNPGKELLMDSNPLLVYRLFHSYSARWGKLASDHIENIHRLCEEFLTQILDYAWPKRIESRIWAGFIKIQMDSMRRDAGTEMNKLLGDRMKLVTPYENEFSREWYGKLNVNSADKDPMDPEDQQYDDVLRKMLLVYQSKLRTFMTNVITQVVERHIADGLEEVFHSGRVRELDVAQIKALVEDDYQVRTERKDLRAQEKTFAQGKDICRDISRRPDLGPYEYQDPRFQQRDNSNGQRERRNGKSTRQKNNMSHKYSYPSENLKNNLEVNGLNSGSTTPGIGAYGPLRPANQNGTTPPPRPAPESPQSPNSRPPAPGVFEGLRDQSYHQTGDIDQFGQNVFEYTTSVPLDNQSEEHIAFTSPSTMHRGEHSRKNSSNLLDKMRKKT